MTGDAIAGNVTDTPAQPGVKSPDNLDAARLPAVVAQAINRAPNTADQHLPNTVIANDVPFNPYHYAPTDVPAAINFAKSAGFNDGQIQVLAERGPEFFSMEMEHLKARPDKIQQTQQFANGVGYWQTHPDVPFNPFNMPGTYDPQAIAFARASGFDTDQIHVLQQYGPGNFNATMDLIKRNPAQADGLKGVANLLADWEKHPDLPADPKADASTLNPQAVQFAQANGFDPGQIAVLEQFGAENFNDTMQFLKGQGDKIDSIKNLTNFVEYWETHMAPGK